MAASTRMTGYDRVQPDDAERRRPVRDADHADRPATASTTASCTPARWTRWAIASATIAREMDHALFLIDAQLAAFLPRWLSDGYEVIVTADHGQTGRGHHGGHDDEMQDFALYYFGSGKGPEPDLLLDQLQLAPTILTRLGVPVPATMKAKPFLD